MNKAGSARPKNGITLKEKINKKNKRRKSCPIRKRKNRM